MALHTRILIGLAVGVIAGVSVNFAFGGEHPRVTWVIENITQPIGQLFLNLLLMIVVPLVFSSLVVGVAGIGDIRKLGRVGLKTFAYTIVISAISVVIGLILANTIKPGTKQLCRRTLWPRLSVSRPVRKGKLIRPIYFT